MLVGLKKRELICHKAILCFYSEFFDAAFYGGFAESHQNKIYLPEEDLEGILTFVSWAYSGTLESTMGVEDAWAMGERLQIPQLCNDTIFLISVIYKSVWISASSVATAYSKTSSNSKPRKYILDMFVTNGPLCPKALKTMSKESKQGAGEKDWNDLVLRGGEAVLDIARTSGFLRDNKDIRAKEAPYNNCEKYLVEVKTRPMDCFLEGKKRGS